MARAQQRIAPELFADRPDVRQIMVSADRASSSITPNPNSQSRPDPSPNVTDYQFVAAHRVADGLTDRFTEQRRHPGRGRPGGQPAGFGDQHRPRSASKAAASASGTSVVLPVPGGATSTALPARPARR